MAFPIPPLTDTFDLLRAMFRGLFPDRNIGAPRSYHARRTKVLALAVTQLHAHISAVQSDVMPDTAGDDGPIDRWGAILGVVRKGATAARKSQAARVRGTVATPVPFGQQMTHPASGLIFQINTATVIPAAGFIDCDIAGVSTGSATRLADGETLEFVATPVGLETQVVLQKDLDEDGYDTEQFGAYRARVLAQLSQPSAGGTQADYVKWMLQVPGISAAFCYPNRAGIGTVDLVPLHAGSGSARICTGGELATVLAYVKTLAPASIAGVPGALRTLTAIADPELVELTITPNGDSPYAFDWVDIPGLTVLAWTAGTRELQFSSALPATLKAGHRLILKGVASVQDGRQYVIEAISAADKVILQSVPINAPAATDLIYSGGPLVDPIRSAILAHVNGERVYAGKGGVPTAESALASTVGLEVLAEGVGPANPAGVYGTWSGGLIRAQLFKIATHKTGVRNCTISTPALDYEATDYAVPNDSQIGLITPSAVIVRSV